MKQPKKLYKALDIEEIATKEEIKKAYIKKAKNLHPDKNSGRDEEFKAISIAYDILKSDEKRAQYDLTGDEKFQSEEQQVRTIILDSFNKAIQTDAGDSLIFAIREINQKKMSIEREIMERQKFVGKLKAKIDKIRPKKDKKGKQKEKSLNYFNMVLEQNIAQMENIIEQMKAGIEILNKALLELGDWESMELFESDNRGFTTTDVRRRLVI